MEMISGRAGVAMISAQIEVKAKIVNENNPGSLDISSLQTHQIGASKVLFIIHLENPVSFMSGKQMRGILDGAFTTNWRQT
jgi:ABC-type phosphate transport system substrate-binding protein